MRVDGREPEDLRPITFERDFTVSASGSVLVSFGKTVVLCTASIDEDVPRWMRGTGKGWVTAEYSMLPGAGAERIRREVKDGKPSGRTQEIQRLIGRSLRAVCDMVALGERQVIVDCDVLQADGGTRTAAICGGYLALHDALSRLKASGIVKVHPLDDPCAAISVGIVAGVAMLDLAYIEDSRAEVDMNVVMTGSGRFIEVQGTAEGLPFTRNELDSLLALAEGGIKEIVALQHEMVAEPPPHVDGVMQFVLASANPDKVAEIQRVLTPLGIELLPRPEWVPEVVEDGDTLEDNARLKAGAVCRATGQPALADDTGLEVDALGGAPGVRTARFAGEHATYADNVTALLDALAELPDPASRSARFRAVAMVQFPSGREVMALGIVQGTIAAAARGTGGFGYDPVFVPDEGDGRTFAEMGNEKHTISHRGRSLRTLVRLLGS